MLDAVLHEWPWVGLALAPVLVLLLVRESPQKSWRERMDDPVFVLPLLWPMYLLHQFEEHGRDIFGRRYPFMQSLCDTIGHHDLRSCPATPAFLFAVNVLGCQVAFVLSWMYRRKAPLIAACAWGIPLVNAFAHIVGSFRASAYNPGTLTSVVLFLPLSLWMLRTVLAAGAIEKRDVPRVVASGVATHAVLLASLTLQKRGWIPYELSLLVQALNGFLPLIFGAKSKPAVAPSVS